MTPEKIINNGIKGLFIDYETMDSLSVKMIDRKYLLKESKTFGDIMNVISKENSELRFKNDLALRKSDKFESLYNVEQQQNILFRSNINDYKLIVKEEKKKSRKNGLILFGGGVSVGIIIFAVLTK